MSHLIPAHNKQDVYCRKNGNRCTTRDEDSAGSKVWCTSVPTSQTMCQCWWIQSAWRCTGICQESKGIGEIVPVHCTTTIGEITIVGGWRWRISDIAEDTMIGWDELDSSWIVGIDGTACGDYSTTKNTSIFVSWGICQQLEVSKGDPAEVSKSTRKTEVEEAVEKRWA